MSRARDNFELLMRDERGGVVPGSIRSGHNVMTLDGRDLMAKLLTWATVGSPDVAYTQRRARYIGVGGGLQVEDSSIVALVSPVTVNSGGDYLKELDCPSNVFPFITSAIVKAIFGPSEITWGSPSVMVSEAGLYFDVSPGGVLSVSSPSNVPAFYKSFEPIVKLSSFSMEITWELRF